MAVTGINHHLRKFQNHPIALVDQAKEMAYKSMKRGLKDRSG